MLLFMTWGPRPDAAVWPGRRLLAVLDAIAWPATMTIAVVANSDQFGVIGLLVAAVAPVLAVRGAWMAMFQNHRYAFTTWCWGRSVLLLLAIGLALKAFTG
jgi:hypothetical protein